MEMAGYESGFAGGVASLDDIEAARAAATDEARDAVERTVASLPRSVPTERTTVFGDAGPRICQLAREIPADVVVVGSGGRGAMRRALFGSVSSLVVRHAPCPVLVVGAGD
jgi:nucleotide-binding universal stress UspA family protein